MKKDDFSYQGSTDIETIENLYCGLQCVVGKSRKEILKQHQYFSKK